MASADSALLVIAKALWNPKPTTDAKSQQYLANALGYPRSWQVVRTIEEKDGKKIIVDRIYAGSPDDGVDMYFNHHAAQAAAADWIEGESNGYEKKGGQLLPRKPKFQKGDRVQVDFEGDWYNATIQKRTERKDGYRYTVFYPEDNTTQTQVKESSIKFMDNPVQVAEQMGLDGGWEAKLSGKKWKFTSPDGKNFTSKVAAMKHYKKLAKGESSKASGKKSKGSTTGNAKDEPDLTEGDPPWRTTGHDYLGRRVKITTKHQKSATRTVSIDQEGTVVGWIADTDVDTNGEPGFVSERSHKPANLFHCVFDDEPGHPYLTLLVERKDMEEYEVEEALIEQTDDGADEKAAKKQKTS